MRLAIFAATGGIGRHLLTQSVAAGHDVTAVVRDPARLTAPEGVRVVTADLVAPGDSLVTALGGIDAVLSGLGPRTKADSGIAARGTRAITEAMKAADVRRIVVVSAAPVGTVAVPGRENPPKHDPGDGFIMRHVLAPIAGRALRKVFVDLAEMEAGLAESGLDWTSVRPPRLTDKPLTRTYRTAYGQNLKRGLTVSRADVAHFMLAIVDRPATYGQTIGIAD